MTAFRDTGGRSGTGAPARSALAGADGSVDRAWLRWLEELAQGVRDAAPRVGDFVASAAADRGPGWLRCDGTERRRADYPALAAVLDPSPVPPDKEVFSLPDIAETVNGRTFIRAR